MHAIRIRRFIVDSLEETAGAEGKTSDARSVTGLFRPVILPVWSWEDRNRGIDYIGGDDEVLEKAPLERVAADGQLMAYKHEGFWQCMDTQREKQKLEELWATGAAPWKIWKD